MTNSLFENEDGSLKSGQGGSEALAASEGFFIRAVGITLGLICLSVEILVRTGFGERYLSLLRICGTLLLCGLFFVAMPDFQGGFPFVSVIFSLCVFVALFRHHRTIRQRKKAGLRWYSIAQGQSVFRRFVPASVSDNIFYIVIEPLCVIAAGCLIALVGTSVGLWFCLAGWVMFLKAAIAAAAFRKRILDHIDRQIEAEWFTSALDGTAPKEAEGYFIAGMSGDEKERTMFKEIAEKPKTVAVATAMKNPAKKAVIMDDSV